MKRRLVIWLSVLALGVAIGLLLFGGESGGPIYRGRPLDYWFRLRFTKNPVEADEVLRTIGPEAVPYLRTLLRKNDSALSKGRDAFRRRLMNSKLVPLPVRTQFPIPVSAARARVEAARILQRLGPAASPAVPELAASLDHPDRAIRYSAFEALTAIGPEGDGVVSSVVQTLKHSDPSMRLRAATALSEFKANSAIVAGLVGAVNDPNPGVRRAAVQALADVGPAAIGALPQLTPMLREEDEQLRLIVADALWRISPDRASVVVPLLIEMIGVDAVNSRPTNPSSRNGLESQAAAIDVLGEMGSLAKDAAPSLLTLLRQGSDGERFSAANALRKIEPHRTPSLVPVFVELLASTNDLVWRPEVIEALGEIGSAASEALPMLVSFLNDEDETMRLSAAAALWRIDPQKADTVVPVLVQLLNADVEAGLNASDALDVLMEMGPASRGAISAIRALLSHDDNELRHAARAALAKIDPNRSAGDAAR